MEEKLVIRKYRLPIYNTDLQICIGSKEEFLKYTKKKYHITYEESNAQGCYYESVGDMPDVIFMPEFNWCVADLVSLTHELLHFVFHALGNSGISLDRSSEEAFTYAMTEIQEQVWRDLVKLKEQE